MKLIRPTVTILKPDPEQAPIEQTFRMIEVAGRTCYKSEDKITDGSAKAFVDMLIDKGHTAMLEHGTVYLAMPSDNIPKELKYFIINSAYTSCTKVFHKDEPYLYATTNYRVIFENNMHQLLKYQINEEQFIMDTLSHLCRRVTVRFICDRGVSHEFVRHRVFSFAQESTRFCNYSKDKFGNELTFILPCWLSNNLVGHYNQSKLDSLTKSDNAVDGKYIPGTIHFLCSLLEAETEYMRLLKAGWTPQQARAVLPNATKTELAMTGTVEQWLGFFTLRCASSAHPQARELALDLLQQFEDENYIADDEFNNQCDEN